MAHENDDDVPYDYEAEFRRDIKTDLVTIEASRTDNHALRFVSTPTPWPNLKARLKKMPDIHEDIPEEIEDEIARPRIFTRKIITLDAMQRQQLGLRPG
jgi:hypothetical protein